MEIYTLGKESGNEMTRGRKQWGGGLFLWVCRPSISLSVTVTVVPSGLLSGLTSSVMKPVFCWGGRETVAQLC